MDEEIKEIKLNQLNEAPLEEKPSTRKMNWRKIVAAAAGIGLVLVLLLGVPLAQVYSDGKVFYTQALAIKDAAKSQDIIKTREAIVSARKQLGKVRSDIFLLGWTKYIPFFGGYSGDLFAFVAAGEQGLEAAEIMVTAVEPYADVLGLKGQGSFAGGTAEERIAKLVETLDKVMPQVDAIAAKIAVARKELDEVNPDRYPTNLGGLALRSQVAAAKEAADLTDDLLTEARPMVKQLPSLLGTDGEKRYLVLFQNDAELRPTGGFITAYAIFRVEKGKINLETSDDIYKLDDTMTKHVAPPEPISKYLNVFGWRMRDANFSPDFYSSMKTFEDLYATSTDKRKIDGIIAMDTNVLVALMDVLGPVSTYGVEFNTKKVPQCDCPMVIWELEKYADEPKAYERGSRKDIIGVLLSELMRKAMASPRQTYSRMFPVAFEQARQKHILFYVHNEDAQRGVEALGFAGRIKTSDGDYLHINDANLAGAKSNLFVVPTVKQEITLNDSGASTVLTLDYRYPRRGDNCSLERKEGLCLAGVYRDYLRVYLPKGAVIEEARGFENKSKTFEDLNHTVVDGFFTVVPQGLAKIQIKYRVAGDFKKQKLYRSLIQKQPGTDAIKYQVSVNGKVFEFNLAEDKELTVKL